MRCLMIGIKDRGRWCWRKIFGTKFQTETLPSNGRRQGGYWLVGDVENTPGRSLFVRLRGPDSGKGAAGKWTDYVAPRVMLRPCDWASSHDRSSASTQHNLRSRGVA